uniref:Circadian associated repressor of transcription n=1 Tax=Neogobius melanostomus TaxID=47308 RepID=A0A8C6TQ41_9GOBI
HSGGESISKTSTDESEPTSCAPKTQGDLLFSQKCAELQGYVRPLLELLNGLKKGRFDRGLSSFQQSVAMDRIQRIVGVLQRPTCGEKYLNTLLQVEVMLKLWFPQIKTFPVSAASSAATSPVLSLHDTAGFTPPHKNMDQSHIPVKVNITISIKKKGVHSCYINVSSVHLRNTCLQKRRLSWTGTDSSTPSPVLLKVPHLSSEEEKNIKHSSSAASDTSHTSTGLAAESTDEQQGKSSNSKGHSSEPSLTWVHVAPILSPRKSTSSSAPGNGDKQPAPMALTAHRKSPATQDSSVSSTTTKRNQKNTTKPARCQSQPSAAQLNDGPSRSKPPSQVTTFPRARPTPLET